VKPELRFHTESDSVSPKSKNDPVHGVVESGRPISRFLRPVANGPTFSAGLFRAVNHRINYEHLQFAGESAKQMLEKMTAGEPFDMRARYQFVLQRLKAGMADADKWNQFGTTNRAFAHVMRRSGWLLEALGDTRVAKYLEDSFKAIRPDINSDRVDYDSVKQALSHAQKLIENRIKAMA
jgi:hypothetical protein